MAVWTFRNHEVFASMQSGVATPESHGGEAERLRLAGPRFARLPGGQN